MPAKEPVITRMAVQSQVASLHGKHIVCFELVLQSLLIQVDIRSKRLSIVAENALDELFLARCW